MAENSDAPIPILDLRPEVEALWPQLSERLKQVVHSGQFILGPETQAFEKEIAEWLGCEYAVGVNSGTDALVIGLRAAGVEPGDEVITSPFSFFASAESISILGAKPVFVDVDLESMNIDADKIEAAITDKTKAILPVHLFGRPCSMNKIMKLAERHGLKVVEDCAQSFGATYRACPGCELAECKASGLFGKQTGTIGDLGCFSFFPTKNLGAYGDGGLITTDDPDVAQECRKLRAHGSLKRYQNEVLGYNSRLDSIQAAILRLKLPLVTGYNEARRALATRYNELLADVEGVVTPAVVDGHVFHQYTIRLIDADRDAVVDRLKEQGVTAMVYYPIPQDKLPVYNGQYPAYEVNDRLSTEVMSLPMWPQLTAEQQERVVQSLRNAL